MIRIPVLVALFSVGNGETVQPFPRPVLREERVLEWTFEEGLEGWRQGNNCVLSQGQGTLLVESLGEDPYLYAPSIEVQGPLSAKMRIRDSIAGGGAIYWITREDPQWSEGQCVRFPLSSEGSWEEVTVVLETEGLVTGIRLDPGNEAGGAEVDSLCLARIHRHPLRISKIRCRESAVTVWVRNHGQQNLSVACREQDRLIEAGKEASFSIEARHERPFEEMVIEIASEGLPPLLRTVHLCHSDLETDWTVLNGDEVTLKVAPDGSGARIEREGRLVAFLCPLVQMEGAVPEGAEVRVRGDSATLRAQGVQADLRLTKDTIHVRIASAQECEGPVVRVLGSLQGGVFAGLEYLGAGERSSSTLDIETEEHLRYAPDRYKVTQPLMVIGTDEGCVAMVWEDMSIQPIFASPNFFEGGRDHRMSLKGSKIECSVRAAGPGPVEEAILWSLRVRGLPPLPVPPRTAEEQWELCLASLEGPVRGEGGWGHCAEERWPRQPFSDVASTIWRLTGEAPKLETLVPGGAHVKNDSIYFVTGRAKDWLAMRTEGVRGLLAQQGQDGSFRYEGEFLKGHFENTASGFCAQRTVPLLEFARYTGDEEALEGGVRALEYMRRFQVPRGAQTWELSLHTPDILASAYLVWAYTRGYELTGEEEYLEEARRWALSGVPFVYLWSDKPVMLYGTIAVFGATHWKAPNWMGLPVQWCGGVYAYALGLLAPHERTIDWERIARGILVSAEQQQYPDGELIGTLPDSFEIKTQTRRGPNINPCALVSLRLLLDGELDSLAVGEGQGHRVVAPFPVSVQGRETVVQGEAGRAYQVLVDGDRVVDVVSNGEDRLKLW